MPERIDHVTVCRACRSTRVQWEAWVDINRSIAEDSSSDDYWCPRCDELSTHRTTSRVHRQRDGSWNAYPRIGHITNHKTLREAIRAVATRKIPNWKLTKDATK